MTDFRALCSELATELEAWEKADDLFSEGGTIRANANYGLAPRARAALAEEAGVGVTAAWIDDMRLVARDLRRHAEAWEPNACLLGNVTAEQINRLCADYLARFGTHPRPIPVAERLEALEALSRDAVSALRYIEQQHGRLYGVGWDRVFDAAAALAEGAGVGVTDAATEEVATAIYEAMRFERLDSTPRWELGGNSDAQSEARETARFLLSRYGTTHPRPIPVADTRYEFAVLDCEDEEQAGGSAATLADAIKEGNHYLALYSNDDGYGPYRLELREVRTLLAAAIPLPEVEP